MNQRVLQPLIGQAAYAQDLFLGSVERVMIGPHHRRVTAFVVRGNFPDLEHSRRGMLPDEIPRKERQVVLPIYAVHIVSISGVLLTVSAADAARCPDFDPGEFIVPDLDWQPPYPYKSSEVLLDPTGLHVQKLSREVPEGARRG